MKVLYSQCNTEIPPGEITELEISNVSNYRLKVIRGGSNHVSIANESGSTSLRDDISITTSFKVKLIPEHSSRPLLDFAIKGNRSTI